MWPQQTEQNDETKGSSKKKKKNLTNQRTYERTMCIWIFLWLVHTASEKMPAETGKLNTQLDIIFVIHI